MCGRTALTLNADAIQCACSYKREGHETLQEPQWVDEYNFDKTYIPSFNIAPTEVTPVLVSAGNFGGDYGERILKPMMWGMIPPWHKGNYKTHGLSTNNCRLETVNESRLYGEALKQGNCCVVLAEGFYEWQTTDSSKQPYYIYNTPNEDTKSGLLRMAGVYGCWLGEDDEGIDSCLYSYSVLTKEADSTLSWLHHRMPVFLETDAQIRDWLNPKLSHSKTSILNASSKLSWHPVSTVVNNSRNKLSDCNKPVEPALQKSKKQGSRSIMDAWLGISKIPKKE